MSRGQPSWWAGASFCAKAAYLQATGQARTFEQACSMLARRRKQEKPKGPTPQEYQAQLEKRGLS